MYKFEIGQKVRMYEDKEHKHIKTSHSGIYLITDRYDTGGDTGNLYRLDGSDGGGWFEWRLEFAEPTCPVCNKIVGLENNKIKQHGDSELCYGSFMPFGE